MGLLRRQQQPAFLADGYIKKKKEPLQNVERPRNGRWVWKGNGSADRSGRSIEQTEAARREKMRSVPAKAKLQRRELAEEAVWQIKNDDDVAEGSLMRRN